MRMMGKNARFFGVISLDEIQYRHLKSVSAAKTLAEMLK
jgi:hypothetical protein